MSNITNNSVVDALIWLVLGGLVYWLFTWALGALGIPEPFNKVAKVIGVVAAFLFVLNIILRLAGHPLF